MAQIKGIINAKGKSGEIIANNGAYFVDLTNATESSGTYTIPSADIENGDFTLQVGDTLIDKDSGSMLKVATLTPSITASLVFEASSGGGGLKSNGLYILNSGGNDMTLISNDPVIISLPKTDILNSASDGDIEFSFDLQIGDYVISETDMGWNGTNYIFYGSLCMYIGDNPNDNTEALILVLNHTLPSPIIANPTATGSEVALERITINNVDYKVGGTQKYRHNVKIGMSGGSFMITFDNTRANAYTTIDDLLLAMIDLGYTSTNKYLQTTGVALSSDVNVDLGAYVVVKGIAAANQWNFKVVASSLVNAVEASWNVSGSVAILNTDTVIPL